MAKISELIKLLQMVQEDRGDLPIQVVESVRGKLIETRPIGGVLTTDHEGEHVAFICDSDNFPEASRLLTPRPVLVRGGG